MKIIDAHHHLWDPTEHYYPWLCDEPPIAFRYGDYRSIRRPFLLSDYDKVSSEWNVVASVTMEGEWNPADPTGEAVWMQQLADDNSRPAAHVAQAWLDSTDLPQVLERYADLPVVRSVRHKPIASGSAGGRSSSMSSDTFKRGFRSLSQTSLHFDLQVPWWHLNEVEQLFAVASDSDTLIILNHCGLPADRSPEGIAGWRSALRAFAQLPNTRIKLSGIGIAARPWLYEENVDILQIAIDLFGPQRSMFASNFPVDGLCASFDTLYSGYLQATKQYTATERHALFFETAAQTYSLDKANL